MKTNKRGISLIVLVITIVVMIILAAAIILSLRSDGIIGRANQAKSTTDASNAKDLVAVARSEWTVEKDEIKEQEGVSTFKEYAEKRLRESGYKITTTTDDKEGSVEVLSDGTVYIYPVIPEGFVASDLPGEDQVSEGLVIYEGTKKVSKDSTADIKRNQFVWVPVNGLGNFIKIDWKNKNFSIALKYLLSCNTDSAAEVSEYKSIKSSVEKYGGFYIARYEAGLPTGVTTGNYGQNTGSELTKPVSVKGAASWTNIPWDSTGTTDENAVVGSWDNPGCAKVARNAYASSESVISHLVYGEEWDAALTFISKTNPTYPNDSTKGNSGTQSEINTGLNDAYKANNIYDMAGNAWEWTMEVNPGWPGHVMRGADIWSEGPAASRQADYSGSADGLGLYTFRVALCLK